MASAANPTVSDRFLTFIKPHLRAEPATDEPAISGPAGGVLLAVSGGLDSVVMTHLFQNAGFRFGIAHVNFGLRGDESDGDARFVEQLAATCHVPFYATRFETSQVADAAGVSIQMAARTLRYDWFEQVRAAAGYDWIATGHHRNDVFETVLLNFTRGTGLAGLRGMAVRQGHLLRPLLFADRADLEAYAADHQLDWREDRSNAGDDYARNRIRHHVVPVLQTINPGLLHTLDATLDRLRAAEVLAQHELDRSAKGVVEATDKVTHFKLNWLRTLSEPVFRLSEWLRPFGFTYQQTTAIWQAIGQGQGQQFRSATHRLIHERDQLVLSPTAVGDAPPDDPILVTRLPEAAVRIAATHRLAFRMMDKPAGFVPSADPLTADFDADQFVFPLTIRRWRAGDRFQPLGLNGHKLVSDLLTDQKINRLEREWTQVLLSGDRIAWVIGKRIAHHFRVTNQTRRILNVQQLTG